MNYFLNYMINPNMNPACPVRGILVVDDDPNICQTTGELVLTCIPDAFLVCTGSPVEALKLCRVLSFNLVITDIWMPVMQGYELIPCIRKVLPSVYIIAMTGQPELDAVFKTGKSNPDAFLIKGSGSEVLFEKAKEGLAVSEARLMAAAGSSGKETNWRKRGLIRKWLGMSVRAKDISRMRMHALALMKTGKYQPNEIAKYSGFSSVQIMQKSLIRLESSLLGAYI